MINSMDDFINKHPNAVIVNYDITDKFDCGKIFRTSNGTVEDFRKYRGKYNI